MLHRYFVTGPERTEVFPLLDDGTGPTETGCAFYEVDAPNRHAARWAAFRHAWATRDSWYTDLHDDHPLAGVKVTEPPSREEWAIEQAANPDCPTWDELFGGPPDVVYD